MPRGRIKDIPKRKYTRRAVATKEVPQPKINCGTLGAEENSVGPSEYYKGFMAGKETERGNIQRTINEMKEVVKTYKSAYNFLQNQLAAISALAGNTVFLNEANESKDTKES